ncbi:MAG: SMR family transporter [Acidobacteriota bacterium]
MGFTALAILDTATQVSFKFASLQAGPVEFASHWIGAAARSSWTYVAIAGYLAAFVIWMTLLEHAPVGPAFAVSHIDVVTVLLVSVPLFGERLTATEIAGAACIVAGILCLSRSEERKARGVGDSPGGAPPATTPETAPRSPAVRRAH